jgi:hypothetical protein
MATSIVSGTYATYKAGTTKVLNWLHEKVGECGYGSEQTEQEDEPAGGEILPQHKKNPKTKSKPKKGKGSKAKGIGKAKSKKVDNSTEPSTKLVPVQEYLVLAKTGKKTHLVMTIMRF